MRALILPLLCLCLCGPAVAETRALLVGVGDYTYLDADLRGPANDVALMAEVLIARGVAAQGITVLASGEVPDLPAGVTYGLPHGTAIREAMLALLFASGPGDTVVFHFSGHGSQTPDISGDEPGGFDEILLPMDARGWNGGTGMVEGALLDDDLQVWAQAVLDRGARLVGVIDACHSATGFRAAGGAGVARVLEPGALGIPDDVPVVVGADTPPLRGDFVFLYSSQSDQRSFEYPVGGDDGPWYGAFSLALAQVLRDAPEASWAQVLAATSAGMTRGAVRQDPDGEGPLLDSVVFGSGTADRRYPLLQGRLKAGLLQGLTAGSMVAVYPLAAGGEPVAHARLAALTADGARLEGANLPPQGWAEVVEPAPPPPLRLAVGQGLAPEWQAALADARAAELFEPAAGGADLRLMPTPAGPALVGADGVLDPAGPGSSPRIFPREGESVSDALARVLEQAGHGLRLRGLIAGMAGRGLAVGGPPLAMEVQGRRGKAMDGGCAASGPLAPLDPAAGVAPCDEIWLTLTNRAGKPQDVTVLYQARDFALTPLWPVSALSNRLAPGESARIGLRIEAPPDGGGGFEDILVLAVPATPGAARSDLTGLASPQRMRASADPLLARFAALLEPDGTTRDFTPRRPALAFLRQPVRLNPSVTAPPPANN
ncbi:caspase family protein [Fertoebacter nigrum]|uniref:Caspase family protein n=1 Tax=Fertoeibacter niger TaxID=2656921 RepID=A0A8X8H4L9_9RHOB|nr:caspase family protein [Fertoeibacter niger]NUB46289.1 caspase family protein [Fertoeibacter niger]